MAIPFMPKPSRKMDYEVAKEVYEYLAGQVEGQEEYYLGPQPIYYHDEETGERRLHNPVPYYSTNIDLAQQAFHFAARKSKRVIDLKPYGIEDPAAVLCYLALRLIRNHKS